MNLYKKYLFMTSDKRPLSAKEQVEVVDEILSDELYPFHERSNSLVIGIYKSIEIDDYRKASSYLCVLDDYLKSVRGTLSGASFCGIRKDPGQIYLSLLTARRHISILNADYSFSESKEILDFSASDVVMAPSYTLNVGQAALSYSYYLYSNNWERDFLQTVEDVYIYFLRVINKSSESLPSPSHFGDVMRMSNCLRVMLAGRESIVGSRSMDSVFNVSRISKVSSRIAGETFLKKYELYLHSITRG